MVTLAEVILGAQRFRAFLADRDVYLIDSAGASSPERGFAADLSGGRFVLTDDGVWLFGSEGERLRIANGVAAFFDALGRGFTVADLAAGGAGPSARSAPGLARWAATIGEGSIEG